MPVSTLGGVVRIVHGTISGTASGWSSIMGTQQKRRT